MIIGITGSSGAGKSTVCEVLELNYNVKILNADKIAKKLSDISINCLTGAALFVMMAAEAFCAKAPKRRSAAWG